jgi:tetratricopeptide (TPR) repeat protein
MLAFALAAQSRWTAAQTEPLNGIVVNEADHGIKNVRVVLRAPGTDTIIDEHRTDEDGRFSLPMDSIRPGYELHLHKDGYDDVTLTISPQQLVVANLRVIMSLDRSAPTPVPTPRPTQPPTLATPDQRNKAVKLYNEAIEQWEEAEAPEDKKDALRKIRQAASMDPTFAEPLTVLSRIAIENQKWAELSRYSEALIQIDANDEQAIKNLYVSLIITQHFKRVGDAAKLLISSDPDQLAYVEQHAQEFYKNENFRMARALFQALTEIAPEAPNAYLNLGLCCYKLGDVEGTRSAFGTFVELAPEDHPDLDLIRQELDKLPPPEAPE